MLRNAVLAASAALLVAAPAYAASIHVQTSGRSPEAVKAEVVKAASRLCRAESSGSAVADQVQAACVRLTVRQALAQDPALMTIASR